MPSGREKSVQFMIATFDMRSKSKKSTNTTNFYKSYKIMTCNEI